jgi:HK97 family phage portal protein
MGVFSFLKTKAANVREIAVDNQVYQSLLGWISPGTVLQRDSAMNKYMEYGYGNNADVFAITNKITSLFAQMPIKITQNGKDIENPITPNNRTFFEFKTAWEMFAILSGNAITYVPSLQGGNNAGVPQLFEIMPTHHVEIVSGGWAKPIAGYKFDVDFNRNIEPTDVWHTRIFPNWDYTNGANFMGMSPIKVSVNIINAQNNGYNILSKSFERGMPPGILTRKDMSDLKMIGAHEEALTKAWLKKHGKSDRAGLPVFAIGDYSWIQLGFSTLKDMDVINSSVHGLRTLCNLWGLPSTLFNDQASSTYNNLKTATKVIYTNRVIPDMTMFCDGLTNLYKAKGIKFEPDISQIPEMQEDKMELAKVYDIGVKNRAISRNEFRQALGMEPVEAFGMELEEMLGEDQKPDPEEALRQLQQRNAGNDYDRG